MRPSVVVSQLLLNTAAGTDVPGNLPARKRLRNFLVSPSRRRRPSARRFPKRNLLLTNCACSLRLSLEFFCNGAARQSVGCPYHMSKCLPTHLCETKHPSWGTKQGQLWSDSRGSEGLDAVAGDKAANVLLSVLSGNKQSSIRSDRKRVVPSGNNKIQQYSPFCFVVDYQPTLSRYKRTSSMHLRL